MPRKSSASLQVVPDPVPMVPQRPAPPAHLSPAAATVWREVAASRPADYWDSASCGLLEAYSVALAEHRRISAAIDSLDPVKDLGEFAKLTRLADTRAARVSQLATRMRLSQQSRTDSRAGGRAAAKRTGPASLDEMKARYGEA